MKKVKINHWRTGGRSSVRRRRAFLEDTEVLEPYHKRPRLVREEMTPVANPRREEIHSIFERGKLLDFIWMSSLALHVKGIPMGIGLHATFLKDTWPSLAMQKISYLPQLNVSLTSMAAVLETLKMSQQLADECDQKYMSVTYDLAIA